MRSNMWKSTFREIKQSFGRFMAIFAITALGVSLFSGLKVIQPAMIQTTDNYLKEKEFYNYRVLSTMGFEKEDLEFLRTQDDVRFAEGAVSFDMLCNLEEESAKAIKIYNLPEQIGTIELLYGRLPENAQECVVDSSMYGEDVIGKTIYLSKDNEEDDLKNFKYREYKIVGVAQSPNYIQFERGNTSIGTGRIAGFLYIPLEAFDVDFFTEILVNFEEDFKIYSEEYEAYMKDKEPVWEKLAETAADDRYDRVITDAENELNDAKKELADGKAEGEAELSDAKKELSNAYRELSDGQTQLTDGKATLETSRESLQKAEQEIAVNSKKLEEAEKEIAENKVRLEEEQAKLDDGWAQLNAGQEELDRTKALLPISDREELNALKASIDEAQATLDEYDSLSKEEREQFKEQFMEELMKIIDSLGEQWQGDLSRINELLDILDKIPGTAFIMKETLNRIEETLIPEIEKLVVQIEEGQAEIDVNRALLEDGTRQLEKGRLQLTMAEKEIEDAKKQISDGKRQIEQGWAELAKGEAELAKSEKNLEEGWVKYKDGYAEYDEGRQEFETEIADAEGKISEAEAEIADIERPLSFLLGRETNIGYVCMENDSSIVDGIANVFPVFFYAVAALVCITTMSRMIEEQRTQIGVLKALGYSEASIMGKYLFYSGSAAISGCLFGYFFGTWFFPIVIWFAYSSMYDVSDIVYIFDGGVLLFSLVVSVACSMGVTFISCKNELSEVAAELMRPKAPKAGKRIFLEYIPFLWKRMKFLHKVSYRNVFRYKKRFFMMVIGISGCTGLLVTGFGVQDSIANIANDQYDRIQVFDINVLLSEEITEDIDETIKNIAGNRMKEYIYVLEQTIDLSTDDSVKSVSLVAIDEKNEISPFVKLPDEETGTMLEYPGAGECILTNKLAKTFDLKIGDTVTFRDSDNHTMELILSGITENYLYNFVYMTTQTYEQYLGQPAEMKSIYMNLAEGADAHQMTADLMKSEKVASASVSTDAKERFSSMIESLDLLVVVIIICAGFLAFIVLYNLTNINITERIREIATIKVLGFYKNETSSYVFRENLILTAIGAIAGLGLGKIFHAFVMAQVQVDQVAFDVRVLPRSYLYSVILTFVFAVIVNAFMRKKLDRVSMTESLKSVD